MTFAAVLAVVFKPMAATLTRRRVKHSAAGVLVFGRLALMAAVMVATVQGVVTQLDSIEASVDAAADEAEAAMAVIRTESAPTPQPSRRMPTFTSQAHPTPTMPSWRDRGCVPTVARPDQKARRARYRPLTRAAARSLIICRGEPEPAQYAVGLSLPGRGDDDVPSWASAMAEQLLARVDALQQRYGVLGFPYAVLKKYGDDRGGRHAALITYYGFLSIFPILLVAASVVSTVLVNKQALREEMVEALLPPALQETVNTALAAMPPSGVPLAVGIVALLLSATGVVFSAYETLNHLAGVPLRCRFGWFSRYARVLLMLVVVLAGGLSVAALTVAASALPEVGELQRIAAALATAVVVFLVLIAAAKVLVARPIPLRTSWMPAAMGAFVVALVLSVGARLLAPLVAKSGPVYGSFATVAGIFALLYLVSQTLLFAAEVAVVRHRRLWPRALVTNRPTPADRCAFTRLATMQERLAIERIEVRFDRPARDGSETES